MPEVEKKNLSERDICSKYITPAVQNAGWDLQKQIREEVSFTDGRIMVKGKTVKRGEQKRADYILYYKTNLPIAIIEAKDNKHSVDSGLQQALGYGEILDIPFIYSSNGDGFIEHDRTKKDGAIEKEISLNEFPSPEELFERYKVWKGIKSEEEKIITQDYFQELGGKSPRYFQQVAINRTVEAVSKGQNRILLVMATGTGKTYTSFQIIWRLWKSGTKKRILFLVDRNVLADQTMVNDFKHFGDKMVKIKNRNVDKSYEVYLALYQGITGTEEEKNIYKQFSPNFFDLVVIDECHRGSAAEDSAWREILTYFSSATQIGLTATPKETKNVSNIEYFGEPIYTYSLKQGIEDGFLAPYKVIRMTLDVDAEGFRPNQNMIDDNGNVIEDRIYNQKDYDKNLVIDERTELVAKKVTEFLKENGRFDKTIIFCVDIDHAERMTRALINENADLVNQDRRYVMRITGDNEEGKAQLDNFIDPESKYPVIAVTSKLMTTGVDAQTCKLIVLDTNINSMTEFKQIIGRGTRVNKNFDKYYFTIIDFRKATELFADPEFDGNPVQIYEPKEDDKITPTETNFTKEDLQNDEIFVSGKDLIYGGLDTWVKHVKYRISGIDVKVINERVQYVGEDGKLITESLKDYSRKNILKEYDSLDKFLNDWNSSDKKQAIIEELENHGVLFEELEKESGKELDPFDLICHIAFGAKPLTRKERAENVKRKDYFGKYGEKAKEVLNALLDKYSDENINSVNAIDVIENMDILKINPFTNFGSPYEIVYTIFNGKDNYLEAVKELQQNLYFINK